MCDIDHRLKLSEVAALHFSRLNAHEKHLALRTLTRLADAHEQGIPHTKYLSEIAWADSNIFCWLGVRVIYGIGPSALEIDWFDFDPSSPSGGGKIATRRLSHFQIFEFEVLPLVVWKRRPPPRLGLSAFPTRLGLENDVRQQMRTDLICTPLNAPAIKGLARIRVLLRFVALVRELDMIIELSMPIDLNAESPPSDCSTRLTWSTHGTARDLPFLDDRDGQETMTARSRMSVSERSDLLAPMEVRLADANRQLIEALLFVERRGSWIFDGCARFLPRVRFLTREALSSHGEAASIVLREGADDSSRSARDLRTSIDTIWPRDVLSPLGETSPLHGPARSLSCPDDCTTMNDAARSQTPFKGRPHLSRRFGEVMSSEASVSRGADDGRWLVSDFYVGTDTNWGDDMFWSPRSASSMHGPTWDLPCVDDEGCLDDENCQQNMMLPAFLSGLGMGCRPAELGLQ